MQQAEKLCAAWAAALAAGETQGQIHSVFDRAVNIMTVGGMVSVLPAEKGAYPYAVTVPTHTPFSAQGLRPGMRVRVSRAGLWVNEAGFAVDFTGAAVCSLDIFEQAGGAAKARNCLEELITLLKREGSAEGMLPLAIGGEDTPYSAIIRPRLGALHSAFRALNAEAAVGAAAALAGCGPGLTPSSDDMLLGYVCAFYALKRRMGQAREALLPVGQAACGAAAGKTNEISGSFLRQCGHGLASQNILDFFNCIFSDAPGERVEEAALRILQTGATSGSDILTGIVLSLQTHGRGEDIGKIRSSQERVL